jgi:Uma2 family endonuclease
MTIRSSLQAHIKHTNTYKVTAVTHAAASQAKVFTTEEYLAYDDGTDTRYELVDGMLVEMPPESPANCTLGKMIFFELAKHVPLTLLHYKDIEIEVSGRRAKVRLPDLLVLNEECRIVLQGKTRNTITHDMPPPDLVIEIVSPGAINRARDYRYKRTEYAARGIPEYWIVDPEMQQLTICNWNEGQYEDTIVMGDHRIPSTVIPSWQLTAEQVFSLGQAELSN